MVKYFLSFLIGLLFGIVPFSYMLGMLRGVDIRKTGSGNIGATNLGRNLGFPFFVLGFLLDALKGVVPVILSQSLLDTGTFAGAGAILGHIFNPFFGFRGGKGVATTIGVAVSLAAKSFGLSLGIWLLVYLTTMLVSLASLCFAVALPLFSFILHDGAVADRLLFILVAIMVFFAHRHNIERLLRGREPKTVLWRRK
ncbi:MAG: glycerol-3-phosphate 1-O-acyltransferase PlsY [candidate division WOR-3 bacterium]|nr:glycerol-3-phosphate 1-O-acyltransferase PlsY [candidate division WOR-3 bacterium]